MQFNLKNMKTKAVVISKYTGAIRIIIVLMLGTVDRRRDQTCVQNVL